MKFTPTVGDGGYYHAPSKNVLILSKIYPMLDRPEDPKDLDYIETLLDTRIITPKEFQEALDAFKERIRFEDEKDTRDLSRILAKALQGFIKDYLKK